MCYNVSKLLQEYLHFIMLKHLSYKQPLTYANWGSSGQTGILKYQEKSNDSLHMT